LAGTFVVIISINIVLIQLTTEAPWQQTLLGFFGILMLVCGLGAGITGFVAILRQHERSWLVWFSLLSGLLALFLILGEFLVTD
jgi:peptidoglycan/LPS O-acetylase OafA/YrhL